MSRGLAFGLEAASLVLEIVECSPPYDWEQTSLISARVILDALATLIRVGKLGRKASTKRTDAWRPYPEADWRQR